MSASRRDLLKLSGAAALTALAAPACSEPAAVEGVVADGDAAGGEPPDARPGRDLAPGEADGEPWDSFRAEFALSEDVVHMSAMLIASHPAPVREAIHAHRRELDANPVEYLESNNRRLAEASCAAAGDYLGVPAARIALTDSTTMGIGLAYNGLVLRPGQELLTTDEDYFVTWESLRAAAERSGADVRRIALFGDGEAVEDAGADMLADRVVEAIGPRTRLLALTWVHSSTGLKMPVAAIAERLREMNADRDEDDRVLLGLDAVHGFGIEDVDFDALGCDFLMAGCHKWLFGPRGTGIVAFSERGLAASEALIPSFNDDAVFAAWLEGLDGPGGSNNGARMTPGGFKPFEHVWALPEAFGLHRELGKAAVAERTHDLAGALKDRLAEIPGVSVRTPRDPALSAGIVSFDIGGMDVRAAVRGLRQRRVIASAAPYSRAHVRLTPSIRNTMAEIERAAEAVREIA